MAFDTVDYSHWITKVKKELKLEALDEKHLTLLDGQPFDPFFERKQYNTFESTRRTHTWKIGEMIDLEKSSNADILQMLNGGAQKLLLMNASSETDFQSLLQGVYLPMIHIHLDTDKEEVSQQFWAYIQKQDKDSQKNHTCGIGAWNKGFKHTINIDANHTNTLRTFCEESIAFIAESPEKTWSDLVNNLRLSIIVQNKGIEHIAMVDAVKTLWTLICRSYGEKEILPEIEQIVTYDHQLSIDENFISSTIQAVNAVIATGDTLYIENTPDDSSFSRRINRNIQHLLQLESFMHQSASAYKGSYVIEKMSNKLINKTWEEIKEK